MSASTRGGTGLRARDIWRRREGQATVEAAVLVPTVMLVLAMLLEPACMLYTRCVMRSAAAEVARAVQTAPSSGADEADYEAYALRRLKAVPEVSIFHAGGEADWDVDVEGLGSGEVRVSITGHVRPLPILGVVAGAFGTSDADGVVLSVSVTGVGRPSWVRGSYEDWVEHWET